MYHSQKYKLAKELILSCKLSRFSRGRVRKIDHSESAVDEVAAVVVLWSMGAGGGMSGTMMTVRVEVEVRPDWSVAT